MELELESEKRNHAETIKILRKKERTVKEIVIQCEEDQRNVLLLQEGLDKANARLAQYKRQLNEQVVTLKIGFLTCLLIKHDFF
jgi:preprotein translocase subunit SecA